MLRGGLTETCLAADQESGGIADNRVADAVWRETLVYDRADMRVEKSTKKGGWKNELGEGS